MTWKDETLPELTGRTRLGYVRALLRAFARAYVDVCGRRPDLVPMYYTEGGLFIVAVRNACLSVCSPEVLSEICEILAQQWDRETTRRYGKRAPDHGCRRTCASYSWTGARAWQRARFIRKVGGLL